MILDPDDKIWITNSSFRGPGLYNGGVFYGEGGQFIFENITIQGFQNEIFDFWQTIVEIRNVKVEDIDCLRNPEVSFSLACIVESRHSTIFISDLIVSNVSSQFPIIFADLSDLEIQRTSFLDLYRARNSLIYVVEIGNSAIKITDSFFHNINMSTIKMKGSSAKLLRTNFDYSTNSNTRVLQSVDSIVIRFIKLELTQTNITGCLFVQNSLNSKGNGGVFKTNLL